jgi:hypothetical protein
LTPIPDGAVVAALALCLLSVPQEHLLIEFEELKNDEVCSIGEEQTM